MGEKPCMLFKMLDAIFLYDFKQMKIGKEKKIKCIRKRRARVTFNVGFHDFGCH